MQVISAKPELRKKLVKSNGFWKINAIRPKIKGKQGANHPNGMSLKISSWFLTQIWKSLYCKPTVR